MEKLLKQLAELGIELSAKDVQLDIHDPHERLTEELFSTLKENKRELLDLLNGVTRDHAYVPVPKADLKSHYKLSSAQQRLYFLQMLDKTATAYNVPQFVALEGVLDKARLSNAIKQLVSRHESLRTCFELVDGEPLQKICLEATIEVECFQCKDEEITTSTKHFVRPFDLGKCPLMRVGLIEKEDLTHILLLDMHHIISDGVSQGILINDFMALYAGKELQPLPLQYKDYAEWQQNLVLQPDHINEKRFWIKEFEDGSSALELPTDFARPAVKNYEGESEELIISGDEFSKLKALADQEGATLFMMLLSLYSILLNKLSNDEDIVIGTPIAGRHHSDFTGIIGMFVNMLALRTFIDGSKSFSAFLSAVKLKTLACFNNQSYPYEALIDDLKIKRDTSRNPLFDVMLVYQNFERKVLELPGLTLKPVDSGHAVSKFDLTLIATEFDNQLFLAFEYSTALFKKERIKRFVGYLKTIIRTVVADPNIKISDIELLSKEERNQLLYGFNNTFVQRSDEETIVSLFSKQVQRNPKRKALIFGNETLSYEELDNKSTSIASQIVSKVGDAKSIIGLLFDSSFEMIASMLGVLKAGCAYVPLSVQSPYERNRYILSDCKATLLIIAEDLNNGIHGDLFADERKIVVKKKDNGTQIQYASKKVRAEDLMYVIYTSGTTGFPKGVEVKHKGVVNFILWRILNYNLTAQDVTLQLFSYHFDGYAANLYSSLLSGGTLVIVEETDRLRPEYISKLLVAKQVTHSVMTPGIYAVILNEVAGSNGLESLRYIVLAGEKSSPELLRKSKLLIPHVILCNEYGPTETSIGATFNNNLSDDNVDVIGKPISNTMIYILGKNKEVLPIGVEGELFISGTGVAKGYINNNDLTKEKFIENPFVPGLKMYKTGDIGSWLPEGDIKLKGRTDSQVKIRGYRIELSEVESHLRAHSQIEDAVVLAKESGADIYLVAYYISPIEIKKTLLKKYLSDRIPNYMVPSFFIRLDAMSLTINGKIDKKALPEPNVTPDDQYLAFSNQTEKSLVEIWSELLRLPQEVIGVSTSFFDLGGNSLKATVLVNRILKKFNVEVPIKEIFKHQDIKGISAFIQDAKPSYYSSIEKASEKEFYSLSSAQKRLYFLYEFDKTSTAYNMPQVVYLKGRVDVGKLKDSFHKLVMRHEVLRTSIDLINDQAVQKVTSGVNFDVAYFHSNREEFPLLIRKFIRAFDLNKDLLLRVGLIQISEDEFVLMVDMHHIITDGISQGILISDFKSFYNNEALPELRLHYKDYAEWQQKSGQQQAIVSQKEFWLSEFSEKPGFLELPTDFPRPKISSNKGESVDFMLSVADTFALHKLAEQERSTLFMVVLSVYIILLKKLSNQEDIIVGTPVAGRPHIDLEGIIGMFVNTLPIRSKVSGELMYTDFLGLLKDKTLSCFENQSYQYEEMIDAIKVERNTGRNPLIDVMFSYDNFETSIFELPGLKIEPFASGHTVAKFDLSLTATEGKGQLLLSFVYAVDLFRQESIERFASYFKTIVRAIISNNQVKLSEIEVIPEVEKNELLRGFNNTFFDYQNDKTIIELIEDRVRTHPSKCAVKCGSNSLTYQSLNGKANSVARQLQHYTQTGCRFIPVLMNKCLEFPIAMLSILKSGCGYVPLDINWPLNRIKEIVRELNINVLVVNDFGSKIIAEDNWLKSISLEIKHDHLEIDADNIDKKIDLSSPFFVIYTSGTTGKPKGAINHHEGILNRFLYMNRRYGIKENDVVLATSNNAFDSAAWQILWPLTNGFHSIVPSDQGNLDLSNIVELIVKEQVTITDFVPSVFNVLVDHIEQENKSDKLKSLRQLLIGGEAMDAKHIYKFKKLLPQISITNTYGPSEASIGTIFCEVPTEYTHPIPIGRPIDNVICLVLDNDRNLVPKGVVGELYLGGVCPGHGYVNDEKRTNESFVKLKFRDYQDKIFYKTGDLVKYLPDGNLIYIGRIDNQVKIRGVRIEITEIENRLRSHELVKEAVVQVKQEQEEKYLVAYYVADREVEIPDLKGYLHNYLPSYMIPSYYIFLEQFPLTPNGKLDSRALPAPQLKAGGEHIAPGSTTQKELVKIWSDMLHIEPHVIGVNTNFFDVGGNSLSLVTLVNRINKKFNTQLSIPNIFHLSTIGLLAAYIDKTYDEDSRDVEEIGSEEINEIVDLFNLSDQN